VSNDVMTDSSGFSRALERALRELPSGSAESRLTNYCGRLWDLLRCSDCIEAASLVSCLTAIAALVTEGVDSGEFVGVSPKGTARLLVSSLFARAYWCGQGVDPLLSGSCSRAVVETLDLIWPALGVSTDR
jgi:hypothetical protein